MQDPARIEVPRPVFDGLVVNLLLGISMALLGLLVWTSGRVCVLQDCTYSPALARTLGAVIWILACFPLLRAFRWWDDRRIMPERLTDRLVRSYESGGPAGGAVRYHHLQFEGGAHFTVPAWVRKAVMVGDRLTIHYLPHTHEVVAVERAADTTAEAAPVDSPAAAVVGAGQSV